MASAEVTVAVHPTDAVGHRSIGSIGVSFGEQGEPS